MEFDLEQVLQLDRLSSEQLARMFCSIQVWLEHSYVPVEWAVQNLGAGLPAEIVVQRSV